VGRTGRGPAALRRRRDHGKKKQEVTSQGTDSESPDTPPTEPQLQPQHSPFDRDPSRWWEGGQKIKPGVEFQTRKLDTPLDKITRKQGGRRSVTRTDRKRGRYIQAKPAHGQTSDVAFDATLRAAAPSQIARSEQREERKVAFSIEMTDLQKKVRVKRAANLILFVVDASWSMAVAERMQATKGAIMSLLTDAYQRRDRVGLIVFQKNRAITILPPTNSVQLAQRALADIPVGGKTPLSAGLMLAFETLMQERRNHPDVMPLMIMLTDGAGNVSVTDLPPQIEAHKIAEQFKDEHIRSVVINMEHAAFDQGLARQLAEHLGCECYTLSELKAEALYYAVKEELKG
jgi:magnesium chelatase subunit D